MSVRDFIVFCETVCGRPLTAQQRALAEALLANPHGLSLLRTARQGSRSFIQKLHERFMQGRRADLLIVDDVASSTEAAKLPIENNMSNEAEHSPAPAKPRTQPCYVCTNYVDKARGVGQLVRQADKLLKQEQAAQCDGYDGPCESMEAKERKCRTAYNWDGAGQNPNRTPMLCDECAQAYDEYWNEMWAQAR